jgi:hypothetical protein
VKEDGALFLFAEIRFALAPISLAKHRPWLSAKTSSLLFLQHAKSLQLPEVLGLMTGKRVSWNFFRKE